MNTPHQDPLIARYHEANAVLGQQPPAQLRAAVLAFAQEQAQARQATQLTAPDAHMPPREAANEPRWLLRALGSLAMVGVIGWVVTHFDTRDETQLAQAPAAAEAEVALARAAPTSASANPPQAADAAEPTVLAAAPTAVPAQADAAAGAAAAPADPVVASASPQRGAARTADPAHAPAHARATRNQATGAAPPTVVAQADTAAAPHAQVRESDVRTGRSSAASAPRPPDTEHSPADRVQVAAAPAAAPLAPPAPASQADALPAAAPAAAPVVAAAPMPPSAMHEPVVVASADEYQRARSNAGKSSAAQPHAELAPDAVAAAQPGDPRARARLSKASPAVAGAPSASAAAPSFPAKPATSPGSHAPLREAVARGDVAAVQALARAGADLNARSPSGQTALMQAAARGDTRMVRALLALGADRQLRDAQGRSAADLAEAQGHRTVHQLLTTP